MDAKEKKGISEGQSCHRVVVEKERDEDLNKQNKGKGELKNILSSGREEI